MEKKQVSGAYRLFVIMIFFVASVFFLNNQKRKNVTATHIDASASTAQSIISLSVDQAYHHMNSLFISHNIDLVVKVINQCMHQFTSELVEKIILDDTYALLPEEKMKIIFGAAAYCSSKKNIQYRIFDFLLEYPELYESMPALLVLMKSGYADSVPAFIAWGKERQKNRKNNNLLRLFVEHAFSIAIENNDYMVVEHMFNKKIRIASESASHFLLKVIEQNRSDHFVPLLVRYGQADSNYVENGKTLLIAAVERNNRRLVQALLDEGAVVDRVVDPIQGTALQVAMNRKSKDVVMLLKEYGE